MRAQLRARFWGAVLGFLGLLPERVEVSRSDRPEDLLEASLDLAQTQLLAQIADETSLDGRTMGVLAFLGALVAADVAAQGVLGKWWWTALIGVGLATMPCLYSVFARDTKLGPQSLTFYTTFGGYPSTVARQQLLADLDVAFRANSARVKRKRRCLRAAVCTTAVGLIGASLMVTLDTPTTMKGDGKPNKTTAAQAAPRLGAGTVGAAASHP